LKDKKGKEEGKPLGFLYAPPPGYKPPGMYNLSIALSLTASSEKQEQEEQQEKQNQEPPAKLKLEEKFEFLKNAPRAGSYTQDIQVHHRPLGIEVRLVIYCCRL